MIRSYTRVHERSSALVRVREAAGALAISERSVWRLISLGELDSVRIGRSVRVSRKSLEAFVAKGGSR